jgi:predicted ATPase
VIISHLTLKNWRNFPKADLALGSRAFLVGPNAAGKSNFLDAIKFLRDLAQSGGGLQRAVDTRGGLSKIRCLSARRDPDVHIEISLSDTSESPVEWKYAIGIRQEPRGNRQAILTYEKVWKGTKCILERPDKEDAKDSLRLTQTYLEQINANSSFREISKFLETIRYLHLVPQLVRHAELFAGPGIPGDPFGQHFLQALVSTQERTRRARLARIQGALKIAVPQLEELSFVKDERGLPHLEAKYTHWRPQGGKQREDQFSDGTLRLIGFLWALMEGSSVLLLEEPELSLHQGIVKLLPSIMFRLVGKKRQTIVTTHSADLLADKGIGAKETIILRPTGDGTIVEPVAGIREVLDLLNSGFSMAEAVLPRTKPQNIEQLSLFPSE